jgi:hypothetical protein
MSEILHLYVRNEAEMDRMGYRFGQVFYEPLIAGKKSQNPLVVALYGMAGAGKTTFATAYLNRDESYFNETTVVAPGSVCAPLGDNGLFRFHNFIYPCVNLCDWDIAMKCVCGFPIRSRRSSLPGLDLLEHAPLPHLAGANLAVFVSAPERAVDSIIYFSLLYDFLLRHYRFALTKDLCDTWVRSVFSTEGGFSPNAKTLGEMMSIIRERDMTLSSIAMGVRFMRDRAVRSPPSAEEGRKQGRIVSIHLPTRDDDLQKKLGLFRESLRDDASPIPPRRHADLSDRLRAPTFH